MKHWTRPLRPALFAPTLFIGAMFAAHAASAAPACGDMTMPAPAMKGIGRGFSGHHAGMDMLAPHGSPVRAAADGEVIYAGRYFGYGNMVDVRHADGTVTRYGHLSAFAPGTHPGVYVQAGGILGKVGATGRATTSHLHFEVRVNGHAIDPRPALDMVACQHGPSLREPIEEARAPDAPVHSGGWAR
jgi:murein DD-endopeptidase MepM/ murein hydrolase activator NlpD